LAQVQGENERAALSNQLGVKKLESEMRAKLLDFELKVKEMELKYNTKIDELALKSKSVVESQQVKQSGDIFKKIMEGQQKFFKGDNGQQPTPTSDQGNEG
jgi:hypothetical protein